MTGQIKAVVLVFRPEVTFVELEKALKVLEPWLMATPKIETAMVVPGCEFSLDVTPIKITVD